MRKNQYQKSIAEMYIDCFLLLLHCSLLCAYPLHFFLLLDGCAAASSEILEVAGIQKKLQLAPPSILLFAVRNPHTPRSPVVW